MESEAKHTQQWQAGFVGNGYEIQNEHGTRVAWVSDVVAVPKACAISREQACWNAQVIAAAPEMFAVLQEIVEADGPG